VRQRTQCINALRGHLAEYGHVVPQGPAHVDSLVPLHRRIDGLIVTGAEGR
jgi:transposase